MAVAAIAIPYKPAISKAPQIDRQTANTGKAVERIDRPKPAITLVPSPVVEAAAIPRTGPYSVAV